MCPICKQEIKNEPIIDVELQAKIKKNFPADIFELEKAGLKPQEIGNTVKLILRVGNTHEKIPVVEGLEDALNSCTHKWKAFARIQDESHKSKASFFIQKIDWVFMPKYKIEPKTLICKDGLDFEYENISAGGR